MIYLDYAANTPVDPAVMEIYCSTSMEFYGNPNANHEAGRKALYRIQSATDQIAELLHCQGMEVIYTSGASEANNLAIKGIARAYRENGRHIISTCLEHSSVSGALTWLQSMGYEIDLVNITKDGSVDLEHLRELLRADTILVSMGYVDSELGVRQPIEEIREILREYPNCYFHLDATQAVGKIEIEMPAADLITFAPHKFYGLSGMGILLRKDNVVLEPLIHGGRSTSIYRSGTPVTAQAAATAEALRLSLSSMKENYAITEERNSRILKVLEKYPLVHINSTEKSLPHFINLSVKGIKAEMFQEAFDELGVYVSTKSACSVPNTPSRAVYAVTGDKKIARGSWRISISHLVSQSEIEEFLEAFHKCYGFLTGKI
jgi:cysteine desulfurase